MDQTKLLLNAYYEALHERLQANKAALAERMELLLSDEIAKRQLGKFDDKKFTAYLEACLAFVDERLETYNPIGIQYTFDPSRRKEAAKLELQLDWYDSRAEFRNLVETAQAKSQQLISEERLSEVADELICEVGAFPDRSIISTYEAGPALGKLPDYIVARAIPAVS
ncbi:MAG: hypothetical protein ACYST6_20470 [Planctomycetota bacterium]|jgi:hypothetical protein